MKSKHKNSREMIKVIFTFCLMATFVSANAAEYSYHQMWSYKTRIGEEESEVLINHMDRTQKYGNVYHLTIFNVKIKCGQPDSKPIKIIPYLAVSTETLDKSLLKLTASRYPYMKFHEGYVKWKSDLEAGKAVVYKDTIANILDKLESKYCEN